MRRTCAFEIDAYSQTPPFRHAEILLAALRSVWRVIGVSAAAWRRKEEGAVPFHAPSCTMACRRIAAAWGTRRDLIIRYHANAISCFGVAAELQIWEGGGPECRVEEDWEGRRTARAGVCWYAVCHCMSYRRLGLWVLPMSFVTCCSPC